MHANRGNGTRTEPARCQLQMSDPCPKRPQHAELPPVKHSASWHWHLKKALDPQLVLRVASSSTPSTCRPHLRQQGLQAGPQARPPHTRGPGHKPGQAGPRVLGAGCLNPCCAASHSILAFLRRSGTGSTKLPQEVETSRAGFVWRS